MPLHDSPCTWPQEGCICNYICQFCGKESSPERWIKDKCPYCHVKYDPILAQEGDD